MIVDDAANTLEKYRLQMAEDAAGLHNPDTADQYIQSVADRIHYASQGDPAIVDAIAHGTINGEPIRDGLNTSAALKAHLADRLDIAPPRLAGDLTIAERGGGLGARYDHATDFMFSKLVGEPSNALGHSPVFKQAYWQRAEELAPYMTPEAQAATVAAARDAKLGDVADRIAGLTRTGDLNLDSADLVAKGFGLDTVKSLLHDLSHRSQFGDTLRLIAPFGEAWRQMVTKWAAIGVSHPDIVRKIDQVVTGARGAGFFHKDANGSETFVYPASGWISNKLIGVPIPLSGKVSGLTMATDVLPGVGPAVSMAAGAFIPDQPNWDFARELLLPYGSPDTSHGLLESVLPPWVSKLKDAGVTPFAQNQAAFNSTVMDTPATWPRPASTTRRTRTTSPA